MEKFDLSLAICWTIVFICAVISCASGDSPNWVIVFSPLICVLSRSWMDYFDRRDKRS